MRIGYCLNPANVAPSLTSADIWIFVPGSSSSVQRGAEHRTIGALSPARVTSTWPRLGVYVAVITA